MKLIGVEKEAQRPYLTNWWKLFLAIPLFMAVGGGNVLLWQSQLGRVLLVLVKTGVNLIPPIIWLGGMLGVGVWLIMVWWLWQRPSRITASR